jgi:NADPH:quinone reductase-like Zn-dependent oxidoreductase
MRAWCLNSGFGFENLRLEQRPEPSCGARQVVIRVRAVSLNARDVMTVRGEYNPRQKLPLIVASDAAGEVVQCGAEVHEWRVGDRVCPIFAGLWQSGPLTHAARRSALGGPLDGTLAEYFVADAGALVSIPEHSTWAEAACMPCAGVTAYRALVELAELRAGQWLVCLGTGGVSLAALSIGRALGMRVILTSRSAEKLAPVFGFFFGAGGVFRLGI